MATPEKRDTRILILAPIGRDATACAELLERAGLRGEVCTGFMDMVAKMDVGVTAVLLAEEALFGKTIATLAEWVTNQPPWSDLPFIVLTSQLPSAAVADWRQRLVSALRNASLLERPVQTITLRTAVQAAVRARLRQYQLRELLERQKHAATELEHLVLARTSQLKAANDELLTQISERERVEESLRQAQKMEAIGQLTGGIAHDFNNLLMVIVGGLEMFERHTDQARRQMLAQGMRQAAQRGAALTKQLLAFSRRQPLLPQAVDLARQIGGMRELLDRSLGDEVRVELCIADDLWAVHVDPGELELVLLNLAVNARDAMPRGGAITIRADNVAHELGDERGDFVRLAVIDSGVGMSPEVKDRAFEPFFTTKEVGKGSGLGLAQVYGFAKQSGGSVQIQTEVGRGTTVTLQLPRSTSCPMISDGDPLHAPRSAGSAAGSVLLVEDNDEVAVLVGDMLHDLGYSVARVASASAALDALANGRAVDLVFSDIMMPGDMNGLELGLQIRRRIQGIPVLLTSGNAGEAVLRAESEGFRVLPKPYGISDLASALKMVSNERRSTRAVVSASQ